jgi:hypothetical protein
MGIDNGKVHVMNRDELNKHLQEQHAFLKAEFERIVANRNDLDTNDPDILLASILDSMDNINQLLSENQI